MGLESPSNYSNDTTLKNICINSLEDIFYLIGSNELIKYNNPQII